ncbi:uncharacterized protein LOC135116442 isoform X2 [Scylla paramamosain]|uniref:uncharacterized protein LOC135116442 isoform X2 n=1 Tax=Scylla paramamosain TaxID=85552 RepID=UPI003083A6EE
MHACFYTIAESSGVFLFLMTGVDMFQAESCSKNSYKTSSSNEIGKVPGTYLVQPPPAPAAPSPACPCSEESAADSPVLETEPPTLSGHLQYSLEENMTLHHKNKCADDTALPNPEAPADPATPGEEDWIAPTPLLVEGCGSGKKRKKCFHYCRV